MRYFESRKTVREVVAGLARVQPNCVPTSKFWRIRLQERLTALPEGATQRTGPIVKRGARPLEIDIFMKHQLYPNQQRLLNILIVTAAAWSAILLSPIALLAGDGEIIYQADFEQNTTNQPPAGWASFTPQTQPNVTVLASGVLQGKRSDDGGLVALSRWFQKPRQRLLIEFSFAVSKGNGRVFHVWTQQPDGKDASQLNLCVQGGRLQQFDGRTRSWEHVGGTIVPSDDPSHPVWHRLRAIVDAQSNAIDIWLSEPGSDRLPAQPTATVAAYRSELALGGLSFVSGTRIASQAWYLVDDLIVQAGRDLPAPGIAPQLPDTFTLWTGPPIPKDPTAIPFAAELEHRTIHRPTADGYKFLHGAAIQDHNGVLYANWANSPVNENGPHETLQGRRSTDGGHTWSPLEVIGPGFEGAERHSHGVLFVHQGRLWTICARFGVGEAGKRFPGLKAEAFVLDRQTDRWGSRGIVMRNCWPYDAPVSMSNGNYITGGQDKDGLPVVAISHGDDFTNWDSILIPYHPKLAPSFAETTVWADGAHVTAVIRGGAGVAWIAKSDDCGQTWTTAQPSNLPMPRAKAYFGRLSTGQLYLVSNYGNRDTLVISVSQPSRNTLSKMWRLRHGKSEALDSTDSPRGNSGRTPMHWNTKTHSMSSIRWAKKNAG